ncbi:MAG: class I SAM-dependent methyltransferase [Oscillospiraceae bacterium]|nr:class I SAM-dependent methyltransferase [Oscillospiraceae bacterium]
MRIVFDNYSEGYDDWYQTALGAFVDKVETDAAFSLLNPSKGQKVLDIGCGTGNFSFKLAELGCDVTGIDISDKMLEYAEEKMKANLDICFKNMDVYNMDFEDNTFDSIISMATFEFIENEQEAYKNMLRVLKPNGTIVIGTIQKGGEWQKLYSSDVFKGSAYSFATFKSKEELISLDKDNFISLEECLYVPPNFEESKYTIENEGKYKEENGVGGFVCVSFKKIV